MMGFNVIDPAQRPSFAPMQFMSPAQQAAAAQAAFRPPALMPGPSMMAPQQQAPGFSVRDGMALASKGLAGFGKGKPVIPGQEPERTAGDADLAGYSGAKPGGMVDVGGGVMLPNPNAPDSYGKPDFLTGLLQQVFGR